TLMILAMLTVSVGVSLGFAYSQPGPTYFTPTAAKELIRTSDQHRADGDHQAALAASRRATDMYRRLMRLSSTHYAPHLAGSLHLLSIGLSEVGDHAGAGAAVDEAISIRRQLARFNPARYAASLEQSLQQKAHIEALARDHRPALNIANSIR